MNKTNETKTSLSFYKEVAYMVSKIDKVDYERLRVISSKINNEEEFLIYVNDCLTLYHNNQFKSYVVDDVFAPSLLSKKLRELFVVSLDKISDKSFILDVDKAYTRIKDKLKKDNDLESRIYLYYQYVLNDDFFELLNTDIKFQKEASYLEKAITCFVLYHEFSIEEVFKILSGQYFHFWFLKSIATKNLSTSNPHLYLLVIEGMHTIPEGFEAYPIANIIKFLPYATHKEDLLYVFILRLSLSKDEKEIIYFVVNRFQINRIKTIVHTIDDQAYITIQDVTDIIKKPIK